MGAPHLGRPGASTADIDATQSVHLHLATQQARADRHPGPRGAGAGLLFPVVDGAQVGHQQRHPGQRLQGQQDHPVPGLGARPLGHPARQGHPHLRRLPGRPARLPGDHELRLPGRRGRERPVQEDHQHPEGPHGRAHAAPPALRALRPHPALPAGPFPQGQAGRARHHDQGRGRAARRLHRRRLRAADVPRRPGADGDPVHHAAELAARASSSSSCWACRWRSSRGCAGRC